MIIDLEHSMGVKAISAFLLNHTVDLDLFGGDRILPIGSCGVVMGINGIHGHPFPGLFDLNCSDHRGGIYLGVSISLILSVNLLSGRIGILTNYDFRLGGSPDRDSVTVVGMVLILFPNNRIFPPLRVSSILLFVVSSLKGSVLIGAVTLNPIFGLIRVRFVFFTSFQGSISNCCLLIVNVISIFI